MNNQRYVNDMLIRYYNILKTIRTVSEDSKSFTPDQQEHAVKSLGEERDRIKNLLDQDLADNLGLIRDDFTVRR